MLLDAATALPLVTAGALRTVGQPWHANERAGAGATDAERRPAA